MKKILLITSASILLLASCATNPADCDPTNREAGFINKTRCVISGTYKQRAEVKQNEIDKAIESKRAEEQRYKKLQQQQKLTAAQLKAKRAKLVALNKQIISLSQQAKAKYNNNQEIQKQIAEIEKRAQDNQNDPSYRNTKEAEIDQQALLDLMNQ